MPADKLLNDVPQQALISREGLNLRAASTISGPDSIKLNHGQILSR
jgi:hypothetical protein